MNGLFTLAPWPTPARLFCRGAVGVEFLEKNMQLLWKVFVGDSALWKDLVDFVYGKGL